MTKHKLIFIVFALISVATFGQKKVPGVRHVDEFSDEWAKAYFDYVKLDEIEGFWQSSDGLKYAIKKYNSDNSKSESISANQSYRIYVSEANSSNGIWTKGDIRGSLQKTSTQFVYSIEYATCDFPNYFEELVFGILESPSILSIPLKNGEKILLVKLYPETSNSETFSSSNNKKSSGTGFAISSNGYIVTNHHVIENAKSIEVKGVSGNFSKILNAKLVVSDEKNDLAIIKINDPSFSSFGSIPYSARQGVADVGENVFVLGYPLTSTMGEEVKLTNGIVSSKTGYKGDVSTYQISAPVQPGNSGGPLFDKNGNLIGVVNAKHTLAENASYAIKINYVKSLIELLPQIISFPQVNLLNGKRLIDQVKIASNYTYLILVNEK
jgi:S1-C subfamily serine protease